MEIEPQLTMDMYTTVPAPVRLFLYLPEVNSPAAVTFSARYDTEADLLASLRGSSRIKVDAKLEALSQRLESLRHLSTRLTTIQDVTSEKEQKLIKAVSKEIVEEDREEEHPGKGRRIMDVVKGFLPRKREKAKEELPSEKKAPVVKKVTQIQKKPFKKK